MLTNLKFLTLCNALRLEEWKNGKDTRKVFWDQTFFQESRTWPFRCSRSNTEYMALEKSLPVILPWSLLHYVFCLHFVHNTFFPKVIAWSVIFFSLLQLSCPPSAFLLGLHLTKACCQIIRISLFQCRNMA